MSLLPERIEAVNAKGSNGYTPLREVCYTDRVALVRLLLDRDANVKVLSMNGSTPLLIAARESSWRGISVARS